MSLSTDVILDFVRATNDTDKSSKTGTSYGTAVDVGGKMYVRLDGADNDQLMPVTNTAEIREGERVLVEINQHTAVAYGNTSSPAARVGTVADVNSKVLQVDTIIAHEINADEITAIRGFIEEIKAHTIDTHNLTAEEIAAVQADIDILNATYINGAKLNVDEMSAINATIKNLSSTIINCKQLDAENIEAATASIERLQAKNAEIDSLSAIDATIKYANIDFSRIGEAVLEEFYSRSGLIENVVVNEGHITGLLAGVTIKGDLIEGNTIVADKLVIKGDDGLYYKLNTFGVSRDGKTHGVEYVKQETEVDYVEYIATDTVIELAYYVETDVEIEPPESIPENPEGYTINDNPVYSTSQGYYTVIDGKCFEVTQETPEWKYTGLRADSGREIAMAWYDDVSYYFCRDDSTVYSVERVIKGTTVEDAVTTEGTAVWRSTATDDMQLFTIVDHKAYLVESTVVELTAEQTEYNSLDGSIITAKSIVAEQIRADDLIAFDATIGGFVIDGNPQEEDGIGHIHSVGKESVDNSIPGLYLDSLGQVNIGDSDNFIKYVRNEDGTYSLAISANSIVFSIVDEDGNLSPRSLSSLGSIGEYIRITTYEGEPCIELGESDSAFKLFITNKRILFMDGNACPAYVTNQALHIDKAVVDNELQFGQFIWKKRDNGNMGIIWTDEEVSE